MRLNSYVFLEGKKLNVFPTYKSLLRHRFCRTASLPAATDTGPQLVNRGWPRGFYRPLLKLCRRWTESQRSIQLRLVMRGKDAKLGDSQGEVVGLMELPELDDEFEARDNGDLDSKGASGVRRWVEHWARWGDELRASLRGRRLFTLFALVNLVNYLDRGVSRTRVPPLPLALAVFWYFMGIFNSAHDCLVSSTACLVHPNTIKVVPGGSQEFNAFIRYNLRTLQPDIYLGILQSSFIFGFSVACLIFARLARRRSPFSLMGFGLGVWCVASVLAGLAKPLDSYTVLLLGRLLSGVGEASFVTVVPPLITETAPPGERGLWLAVFYTAQPVGAGMGYVYGSVLATSKLGWEWAFYLEALAMAPLALACALVPHGNASCAPNSSDYGAPSLTTPTNEVDGTSGRREGMLHNRPLLSRHRSSEESNPVLLEDEQQFQDVEGRGDEKERVGFLEGMRRLRRQKSVGRETSRSSPSLLGLEISRLEEEEDENGDMEAYASEVFKRQGVDAGVSIAAADWIVMSASSGVPNHDQAVTSEEEGSLGLLGTGALGSINSVEPLGGGSPVDMIIVGKRKGELLRDALEIVDRPVFCLVVLGAAATAAVTAGMSTFGTGFVTNLELLSSETGAAATFGGVICAAGLVGTPAGGAVIDAADPEGRLSDENKLAVVMKQAMLLMLAAAVLVIAATVQSSLLPFLMFFFLGGCLLFATTAHANLAVMLASPRHLRPLSLAINSVSLHALGDVPSPTLIGALKDALAPHCAVTSLANEVVTLGDDRFDLGRRVWKSAGVSISEAFVGRGADMAYGESGLNGEGSWLGISEACRQERGGLRLTLFIVSSWLLWTCLFFCLARGVQETASAHGMQPPIWRNMRDLISKGLLRRLCCMRMRVIGSQRCTWPCRWRRKKSSRSCISDEGIPNLEQPLINHESSP